MMRATPDSPRMFASDFVDFFSRTHPAVVPLLFVPAMGVLLVRSWQLGLPWAGCVVAYAGGYVTWTLIEYWLHRLFFHWQPGGALGERMHFLVHGVHHQWPRDKYRLVMPPAVSITLFWVFFAVFRLFVGGTWIWPFQAGFVLGYMSYDLTHFYLHHYNPRSAYGLRLKKHHMLHHHKDHGARFGVSNLVWDRVFGTSA